MMRKTRVVQFLMAVAAFVLVCTGTAQAQSKFPVSAWMKLDTPFKLGILREYLDEAKRQGIIIRFSPEYYVKELDSTIANSIRNHDGNALTNSVGIMLHTIAAMDGDWDNGENKLEHAEKFLGPDVFEDFKNMFPQKYAKLLEEQKADPTPWKQLGYSGNLLIHYDSASLSYVSKTVVRVWTKTQYVDVKEGQKDLKAQGVGKKDLEQYDHALYLYEIDCARNIFNILTDYRYRKDGTLIYALDFPEHWAAIPTTAVIHVIARTVCPGSSFSTSR
jgi:hypothetical protein